MTEINSKQNDPLPPADDSVETVFSAVGEVSQQLNTIERFIKRRFDELSMEINATAQQFDMAEEGIASRFSEILEVLKAVSYRGDGTSAANTGVELEAVVDMTEEAAEKILDAADRIGERIRESQEWEDPTKRQEVLSHISEDVSEILLACSFQDLTGQRIKKTLENIREIEDRLGTALEKIGIDIPAPDISTQVSAGATQGDIDELFGSDDKT